MGHYGRRFEQSPVTQLLWLSVPGLALALLMLPGLLRGTPVLVSLVGVVIAALLAVRAATASAPGAVRICATGASLLYPALYFTWV